MVARHWEEKANKSVKLPLKNQIKEKLNSLFVKANFREIES